MLSSDCSCAQCGADPAAAVDGDLCPACLLRLALPGADESTPDGWFGPYRIVRLIGEGGMGRVYLAEQREPIWRHVAIKVLKLGMDTESFVARFQSERQALALLEHPGIARIYDAGSTPDGRPFFAMEYVAAATPITDFCDVRRLSVRERLELFAQVCAAVHHAHLHGVVHRDLKPSNVLVAILDGNPHVKVIDFGVAKAAKPSVGGQAATLFTEEGVVIGTPEYMSPEQAASADGVGDGRTDVYSLGVLLYELMAGVLPYAEPLRAVGYFDLVQRIQEEEPLPPSQRLIRLGAAAEEIAWSRAADVRSLMREIRGDLDWIALRAMRKEPGERYATAADLAEDVERHLRNEPVTAGPPTVRYRARKFAAKHRAACIGAVAVLAVACLAAVLAVALHRRALDAAGNAYIAALNAAALDLAAGDPDAARQKLARCDTRLRRWEWEYLMYRTNPSMATIRAAGTNANPASRSWFGFERTGLVSWTQERSIEQWFATGPASSRTTPGRVLAMNSDGSALAAEDAGLGARIYNTGGFTIMSQLETGGRSVVRAAFDGSGRRLAGGLADGRLAVWDTATGKVVRVLAESAPPLLDIRANEDGSLIAASFADRTIRTWTASTGKGGVLISDKGGPGGRLALMYHVRWLLATLNDHRAPEQAGAGLFEPPDASMLRLYRSRDPIADLAFNIGKHQYALLSTTGELQLCDGAVGCSSLRRRTAEPANSVAFSPDSLLVYTGHPGRDHSEVVVWDASTRGETYTPGPNGPVQAFIADPRDRDAIVAWRDRLDRWSLRRGFLAVWAHGAGKIRGLAGASDGSVYASLTEDGKVRVWDANGRESDAPPAVPNAVAIAMDSSGSTLAIATANTVRLWDRQSTRFRSEADVSGVQALAFRPDGRALAVAAASGVSIRDTRSLKELRRLALPAGCCPMCVAWRSDGTAVAAGDSSGAVHLWNPGEGRLRFTLAGHAGPVRALAFHPNESRIASGSEDRTVRVWTTDTGRTVLTLNGHAQGVNALAWSRDGATLLSASEKIRLWQTRRGATRDLPELAAAR